MAKGVRAAADLRTVHLKCRMRTPPRDNFAAIGAKHPLVDVELWKQSGDDARWRIEKSGRAVVMDGESTVMLIRPNYAIKVGPTKAAFDTGWLHRLAAVDMTVTNELQSALAKGWDLKLSHEKGAGGQRKLVVTVQAKAGLDDDDYLKNKFFMTADTRRVYRFDAASGRLEGLKVYLHAGDRDVLILEVTQIDYNPRIDPAVSTLALPKDVVWHKPPRRLPDNQKYEKMTPQQAARAFFEACGKEDWPEARKFWGPMTDRIRQHLAGLKVIRIGEPFQSKLSGAWFVPYEIRLRSGAVRKHNLALKKPKQAGRFIIDGGI